MYNGIAHHQTIYFIADGKRWFSMKEYQWLLCLKRKLVSSESFSQVLLSKPQDVCTWVFDRRSHKAAWVVLSWKHLSVVKTDLGEKHISCVVWVSSFLVSLHVLWICVAICGITWWASREKPAVPGAGGRSAVTEAFGRVWPKPNWPFKQEGDEGDREFPTINGDLKELYFNTLNGSLS